MAGVVILLTALSASGGVARFGGIPVDAAALQPVGTKLGNGFSVAAGTALVGDVFPIPIVYHQAEPIIDRGWRAILLVTGDPRTVMASYQRQARAAGMELHFPPPTLCAFNRISTEIYECFAMGADDSTNDSRRVTFSLMRGPGLYGPMSHLTIVYNDPDQPNGVFLDSTLPTDAQPGPEPPAVPRDWERLARPGDFLFGDSYKALSGFVAPPLKVEPGSTAAAPVGPAVNGFAGSYDWVAVLRVTDDPGKIVTAYRRQLRSKQRRFGNLSPTVMTRPQAGTTVYQFSTERAGGWNHFVEIVHRSRGDWMLVGASAQT
ncbi:MAG: hypothetical protein WD271_15645 [Acidimicrobiia bacterium]